MKLKWKQLTLVLLLMMTLVGCQSKPKELIAPEVEAPENFPLVTMEIKDFGTIQAELYPHIAPNTVNNFISLINQGFYNGLTIHRIEKGFVLQGGDPNGIGTGGPGYAIAGEFTNNGFQKDLKHREGVVARARANQPDSAGSQFFSMVDDAPDLDGNYAAVGQGISGMDVAHDNEAAGTSNGPVVIESMTVNTYGIEYSAPDVIK